MEYSAILSRKTGASFQLNGLTKYFNVTQLYILKNVTNILNCIRNVLLFQSIILFLRH